MAAILNFAHWSMVTRCHQSDSDVEGIGYHNQLNHLVYTANPGPALILPDYNGKILMETNQNEELV